MPSAAQASLGDQPEQAFRDQTERVLHQVAETDGGVILGRAAAIVLRDHPGALHVRLDGPLEGRVQRAVGLEGVDEEQARKLAAETDRAREAYVKHFYKCDPSAACHYHLVLETEEDRCHVHVRDAAEADHDSPSCGS